MPSIMLNNGSLTFPAILMAMPKIIAKKMIGSMCPFAAASTGLVGTMPNRTEDKDGGTLASTAASSPIGMPIPIPVTLTSSRPMQIAMALVT